MTIFIYKIFGWQLAIQNVGSLMKHCGYVDSPESQIQQLIDESFPAIVLDDTIEDSK